MSFLSNYAHLLGLKPKGARAEDEDDEKAKKAKARRAEDDDDNDPDADDGDDNDPDADDDDENDPDAEEDDDDKPAGRKAKGKKAEDGDDDEADAKVAKGRAIERKRCARIFGSKAAGIRPDMAASLAFGTSLSANAAIAQLEQAAAFGAPQGGRMSLDERMRSTRKHHVGQDAQQQATTGTAGKINEMTNLYNAINGGK